MYTRYEHKCASTNNSFTMPSRTIWMIVVKRKTVICNFRSEKMLLAHLPLFGPRVSYLNYSVRNVLMQNNNYQDRIQIDIRFYLRFCFVFWAICTLDFDSKRFFCCHPKNYPITFFPLFIYRLKAVEWSESECYRIGDKIAIIFFRLLTSGSTPCTENGWTLFAFIFPHITEHLAHKF